MQQLPANRWEPLNAMLYPPLATIHTHTLLRDVSARTVLQFRVGDSLRALRRRNTSRVYRLWSLATPRLRHGLRRPEVWQAQVGAFVFGEK